MKKTVWYLAGLLAVLALGLALSSCGGEPTETPAPTTPAPTTPAPTTPAPTTPTTPPATPTATIPKIPHTLEGRSDCLVCHQSGVTNAPKFPASPDHSAFSGATCSGCHNGTIGPKIPDSHAGRAAETCAGCHKDGIASAPKFPADHSGRTKETCQACHTTT